MHTLDWSTSTSDHERLLEFLNRELRAGTDLRLEKEYPSFFQSPGGQSLIVEENGEIVSHLGWILREFEHSTFRLRLGLIGSVVTTPRARGKGYASQLVQAALTELQRRG